MFNKNKIDRKKLDQILKSDKIFTKSLITMIDNGYSIYKIYNILKSEFNYNECDYLYNSINTKYNNVY